MSALAICDRDGLYGAPRFFSRAAEVGVRAIVGAELTMAGGAVLPVLVQSRSGYQNLSQLLTRAHLRNEKGKCSVFWEELPEFAEGLVALTGDGEGVLPQARIRFCFSKNCATFLAGKTCSLKFSGIVYGVKRKPTAF
jgi:error-prone DNA polymerase